MMGSEAEAEIMNCPQTGDAVSSQSLSDLELIRKALASLDKGLFIEAIEPCAVILERNPDHFDALHLCGLGSTLAGDFRRATYFLEKALIVDPKSASTYSIYAFALYSLGECEAALESYDKAISFNPADAALFNSRGVVLVKLGQYAEARRSYEGAIYLNPQHFEAFNNLGNLFRKLNRFDEALSAFQSAIALKYDYAEAHYNQGVVLGELERNDEALESYDKAIHLNRKYVDAIFNKAVILQKSKKHEKALAAYDEALSLVPSDFVAMNNRGLALRELSRCDDALDQFNKLISLKPDFLDAYVNRAVVLKDLSRFDDALNDFDIAVSLDQSNVYALYDRAVLLQGAGDHNRALLDYDRVISLSPHHAAAFNNRGILLHALRRFDESLNSYNTAISINPDVAHFFNNRGNVLKELKRFDEALQNYERAIWLDDMAAEAYCNRGNVLKELRRFDEALASYDKAIALRHDGAETYGNRANALKEMRRFDESMRNYAKALSLAPDYEYVFGSYLHLKMQISDWSDFENLCQRFQSEVRAAGKISNPFAALGLFDDPDLHLSIAKDYVKSEFGQIAHMPDRKGASAARKIKIGYFSADFHNHATAYLMAELFELHDRNCFEVFAFSFGSDSDDEMKNRLRAAFDIFIDVRDQSDDEIAELSRSLEIDIAIDLKGFTQDARTAIFAHRCAPVQVNFLGYPGTMGAEFIDYIVADSVLVPVKAQKSYVEKVIYLPGSYQVNDRKRRISEKRYERSELGLPAQDFIFCCFNNSFKILPAVFSSWMRILAAVEGSVLWLLDDNATSVGNLRREALSRGVSPDRLVFASRMPLAEHLSRIRCADLFLDTSPYNAHTTASDALWAGVPVLTRIGGSFPARVGASLLNAVGLPELVTTTVSEYEDLAIRLATHPEEMGALRSKLSEVRLSAKLFDAPLYAAHIEAAYKMIFDRHQAGFGAEHIYIPDQSRPRYD